MGRIFFQIIKIISGIPLQNNSATLSLFNFINLIHISNCISFLSFHHQVSFPFLIEYVCVFFSVSIILNWIGTPQLDRLQEQHIIVFTCCSSNRRHCILWLHQEYLEELIICTNYYKARYFTVAAQCKLGRIL